MVSTEHQLEQLLDDLIARKSTRHALIGLESLDRSIRWMGAKEKTESDSRTLSNDIPFFLASIDKMYNAAIVLNLSARGTLNLDDSITSLLPINLTKDLHRWKGKDETGNITIRHLLSHTSGLADWLEDAPNDDKSLVEQIIEEGDRSISLEEMAEWVRNRLRPHFPPQDPNVNKPKIRYSDTNYMLLIAIIEEVTGQSLAEVHERMFIKPLNLRHTWLPGHSQPAESTPESLPLLNQGQEIHIPKLIRSIRGVFSTAGDAMTFLRYLVQNDLFDNQNTFDRMGAHWNRFGFPFDRAALRSPSWPIEYGLGLMRYRLPRIFSPFHPMPPVLGHTGSTGCWLFYCPKQEMLLAGSVNEVTAGAAPFQIVPKILRALRSND